MNILKKPVILSLIIAIVIILLVFLISISKKVSTETIETYSKECLRLASVSSEIMQGMDTSRTLKASNRVIPLSDSKGKVRGIQVELIDESSGLIGGVNTCLIENGTVQPYDATPFETPLARYPELSPEALISKLKGENKLIKDGYIPKLIFVDRKYLSVPIYEVIFSNGSKSFFNGNDGKSLSL